MSYSFHYTAADTDSQHPEYEFLQLTTAKEAEISEEPITA